MKKLFPLLALMCMFVLQGCPQPTPEEKDELTPIKTEYTIGAAGGELSLTFKSNLSWQAKSDASWLKVTTPTKAVTTETVKVVAEENTSTSSRTAKVTISGGALSATIVVTQEGMIPSIVINGSTQYPVGEEGGTVTVDVTSNVSYNVDIDVNWITRQGTTFTVEPNDSEDDRIGVITFSYGDISKFVSIKQNGKTPEPYLNISPSSKSVAAAGETFTVTIATNQGTATGTSSESWVTVNGSSVTVAANPTTAARTATVTFTAGSLSKTVTISQEAKPDTPEPPVEDNVLENGGQSTFTVEAEGGDIEVIIRSNVEYTSKINCDWITSTKATTVREDKLTFHVAANEGAARTATIDFTYGEAMTVTVTVSQKAYVPPTEDPVLEITPTEVQIEAEGGDVTVAVNANYEYTVESDDDWVTISKGESGCVITVAENPVDKPRTTMIQFYSEGIMEFLTIAQAAKFIEEDPFDVGSNLSVNGTANCYVVTKAGNYTFDASVMGNGPDGYLWGNDSEGETRNLWPIVQDHTVFANGNQKPAKAFIIWQDAEVVSKVSYNSTDKTISITATGVKGNVLIGLYDKDTKQQYVTEGEATAIWSWHIWCTDSPKEFRHYDYDDNEYVILDRNLGATSTNPADGKATYGYYYQFGRKDPLRAYVGMVRDIKPAESSMRSAVEDPTQFFGISGTRTNEWFNSGTYGLARLTADLWGNPQWKHPEAEVNHPAPAQRYELKKTIYDPCPPGYMVPPETAWEMVDLEEVRIVENGVMVPTATPGQDSFYPFAGYISDKNSTEDPAYCGWYAFNGFDKNTTTHGESRVAGVYTSHTDWHPGVDSGQVTKADPNNHYGATYIAFFQSDEDDMEQGRLRYLGPYYHIRQRGYPIRCVREFNK